MRWALLQRFAKSVLLQSTQKLPVERFSREQLELQALVQLFFHFESSITLGQIMTLYFRAKLLALKLARLSTSLLK
jgi:hypothetical protein